MPRGRPKKTTTGFDESKAVRLTFRLNEDTVAMFKTIAAIKKVKLEELGEEAIKDVIKKNAPLIKNIQSHIG